MAEIIEIDTATDTFRVMQTAVTKEGRASDLIKALTVAEEYATPFLPEHTAMYIKRRNTEVFVLYQKPEICEIAFSAKTMYRTGTAGDIFFSRIPVGMPARITVVPFLNGKCLFSHTLFMFCGAASVQNLRPETVTLNPWFPNTRKELIGDFCMGPGEASLSRDAKLTTPALACEALLAYMDGSVFNDHITNFTEWTDTTALKPPPDEVGSFGNQTEWMRLIKAEPREYQLHARHIADLNRLTVHMLKTNSPHETALWFHNTAQKAISLKGTVSAAIENAFKRV